MTGFVQDQVQDIDHVQNPAIVNIKAKLSINDRKCYEDR